MLTSLQETVDDDEGGCGNGGCGGDGDCGGSVPPGPCPGPWRARNTAPAKPGTDTSAMYRISSSTAGLSLRASMMKPTPGSSRHARSRSTVTHAGPRHTRSPLDLSRHPRGPGVAWVNCGALDVLSRLKAGDSLPGVRRSGSP